MRDSKHGWVPSVVGGGTGLGWFWLSLGCAAFVVGCQAKLSPEAVAETSARSSALSQAGSGKEPSKPSATARASKPTSQKSPPKLEPQKGGVKVTSSRFAAAKRIVAIGDLHGDWQATRQVFQLVGATNANDEWVGKDLVVVQTGDQLDRGNGEQLILDHFVRWREAAKQQGGALHALNGNHETMNVLGDYRYVTPGGFKDFEDAVPKSERLLPKRLRSRLPVVMRARAAAFVPGGLYARKLAAQPLVVIVGESLFAHGGVHEAHVQFGIDRLNQQSKRWMRGKGKPPRLVQDQAGPLWTRYLSAGKPSAAACAELARVLKKTGTRRLVVGHTVQQAGITSACDNKVWRIDVGMAAHYGSPSVQALEIVGDQVKVLRAAKPQVAE